MKRLVLALVMTLTLAACGDGRECIEGHNVVGTTVVFNGKTTTPVTTVTYVCTEYASEVAE